MELWEAIFSLALFCTLISLFGLAIIRLPGYAGYAGKRLGYYLFGPASAGKQPSEVYNTAQVVVQPGMRVEVKRESLEWCRQVLALNGTRATIEAAAGRVGQALAGGVSVGGLVGDRLTS